MELTEAIMKRRSVRKFTEHFVTNTDLKKILEAARNAPSWANTQCWEFIIVRDPEIIRQVTETYSPANPARKCSASASVIIVACANVRLSGYKQGEASTKFPDWFMFDLGLSVENMCLAAHEAGLGTVIVGSLNHDECNRVLDVPEGFESVVAIPVGKPETTDKEGPRRKELKKFVHLDKFSEYFSSIDSQERRD